MTATLLAPPITRSIDHRYTYQGITYPGVTSIIESVGSSFGAAAGWGAKQTADAAIRLLPELPKMLDTVGEAGVRSLLTAKKNWTRDEAANLGSDVHHLADLLVHGKPLPEMTAAQKTRVDHYARWWESAGWRVRLSEAMVVHPGRMDADVPTVYGWGGTFDLMAYDPDGRTVLADIKTGNVYPKVALQLAAYGMASLVQPADSGTVYPMPMPDRYVILHVTADGCEEKEVSIGTPERMAYLAALDIHHWLDSMKGKRL